MDIFIQQLINGLVLGSMYALVALGYTMVYGIVNLINFAHGEVLMVGALVSWTVVTLLGDTGWPGWVLLSLSLMAAMAVCMALNYAIEKLAYRPLRNAPRLAPLITAMGVPGHRLRTCATRLTAAPSASQKSISAIAGVPRSSTQRRRSSAPPATTTSSCGRRARRNSATPRATRGWSNCPGLRMALP